MIRTAVFLLTLGLGSFSLLSRLHAEVSPPQQASGTQSPSDPAKLAEQKALLGKDELSLGQFPEAKASCEAALVLDSGNADAMACLKGVVDKTIEHDLDQAEELLMIDKKPEASALASRWAFTYGTPLQRARARKIVNRAQRPTLAALWGLLPSWFRELVFVVVVLTMGWMLLLLFFAAQKKVLQRKEARRKPELAKSEAGRSKTIWSLLPLKDAASSNDATKAASADATKATDALLDALARLGEELEQQIWDPRMLLLRPTPPAIYEPALLTGFLNDENPEHIVLAPGAADLTAEWQYHDVRLNEALQNLQLKTAAGIDVGSVARVIMALADWSNSDKPKITGAVEKTSNMVEIHLAARGGGAKTISITTSNGLTEGIDCVQLAAERAALKFLLRMRYPGMSNEQIDGFAALRQGAAQFTQFAETIPGCGIAAKTRAASLGKAAENLAFFRASIPLHCQLAKQCEKAESVKITDPIRQAVLLAEGVARSLTGDENDRIAALFCFRQLQDWPGSPETIFLRQQAEYNEAVLWRQMGNPGRCVLMIVELLGKQAPDTKGPEATDDPVRTAPSLVKPLRLCAELACLSAFAQYTREEWEVLRADRAAMLIGIGEQLIGSLKELRGKQLIARDERIVDFMWVEALRAIGRVELLRVISGSGASLYDEDGRPAGLAKADLQDEGAKARLGRSVEEWMAPCAELAPGRDLFCDIAEACLLLKDFEKAQAYARNATLHASPSSTSSEAPSENGEPDAGNQRAYYLAAESYWIAAESQSPEDTSEARAWARHYAMAYKGEVSLPEFVALRTAMAQEEAARRAAQAAMPVQ